MRRRKSYYGIMLCVTVGPASHDYPGHEERMLEHQIRIQEDLRLRRQFCRSTGLYRQLSRKRRPA